jgi:hypothetical protein
MEAVVDVAAGVPAEALGLLAVMFGEGQDHPIGGAKLPGAAALGRVLPDVLHQPVDVEELAQDRPAPISLAPSGLGRQPDGEGLGEILVGVLLGAGPDGRNPDKAW